LKLLLLTKSPVVLTELAERKGFDAEKF